MPGSANIPVGTIGGKGGATRPCFDQISSASVDSWSPMIAGDGLTKRYSDVAVVDDITSKSRGCSAYSGAMARGRRPLPGLARPARSRLRSSVNRRLRLLASDPQPFAVAAHNVQDRKSTRLNSSHMSISYAVFCLKKK